MSKHLESLAKSMEPDTIHKFRVDMKRLYALIYLVNFVDRSKELKEPVFLSSLYKTAGRLREVQLERKWFEKGEGTDLESRGWEDLMKRKEQRGREKLKRLLPETDRRQLGSFRKKMEGRLIQISQDDIMDFLCRQYESLQKQSRKGTLHRNNLHNLRKKLKRISYLLEAIEKTAWNASLDKKARSGLSEVLDSLGKWHDATVAITHLKENDLLKPAFPHVSKRLHQEFEKKYKKYFKKARKQSADLLRQDLILT